MVVTNGTFDTNLSGWTPSGSGNYDVIWESSGSTPGRARLRIYQCSYAYLSQTFLIDGTSLSFDYQTRATNWYEIPAWRLNIGGTNVFNENIPVAQSSDRSGTITKDVSAYIGQTATIEFRITPSSNCGISDHEHTYLWVDNVRLSGTLYGYLSIISTPSSARIWIDNVDKGVYTPNTLLALTGTRNIKLILTGYQDWTGIAAVNQGQTTNVNATLSLVTGNASFTSTPSGARIYIDNVDQGVNTPITISNLIPGTRSVKLTYPNYYDFSTIITITAGLTTTLDATLSPMPGSLNISSTPSGAIIYIDNIDQGVNTPNTISNLTPGTHDVKLTYPSYYDYTTTVTVNPNATTNVSTILTPLPGNVTITSTPSGARIYIDNIDQGVFTPNTISNLTPGTHNAKLTYPNYYDYTTSINIITIQTITLDAILSPLPGSLHITSTPLGARIYIDNVDQGVNTDATISNLSIGSYNVKLTHLNYQDFLTSVTINPNQTTNISPSLTLSTGILRYELVAGFGRGIAYDRELIDFGTRRIYWNGTGSIIFEKTVVDDKIIFNVTSGTGTFTNQYSPCGGVPLSPAGPFDITNIFSPGYNDLNTKVQDMCGVNIGTWGVAISGSFIEPVAVTIDSTPPGSLITITDSTGTTVGTGTTSYSTTIIPGTYNYTISRPNYLDSTGSFTVTTGTPVNLTGTNSIVMTPALGSVSISSIPSGAKIYIDGIDTGLLTPNTVTGLTQGVHTYRLTLTDYYDTPVTSFNIIGGQTTTIPTVTMIPLECPVSPRYSGNTITLQATPKDGIGPYYVVFRKYGMDIDVARLDGPNPIMGAAENTTITRHYILNDADIAGASGGTIDFSVYMEDSCPTGTMTCNQTCTINIGCIAPVCNFTVT